MTVVAHAAVKVPVPVDLAWNLITSWERQGEWIPMTRVWSEVDDGNGARLFARTGIGRLAFLDTMEITRMEPPRHCEVRHTGRLVRGRGVFLVDAADGGLSRVTWEEHLDLPLGIVGRAGWVLIRPLVTLALHLALRRFARLARAEQRATVVSARRRPPDGR